MTLQGETLERIPYSEQIDRMSNTRLWDNIAMAVLWWAAVVGYTPSELDSPVMMTCPGHFTEENVRLPDDVPWERRSPTPGSDA